MCMAKAAQDPLELEQYPEPIYRNNTGQDDFLGSQFEGWVYVILKAGCL